MSKKKSLALSLLFVRLSIFLVMLVWTIDKFVRPKHASEVFQNYYMLPGFGPEVSYLIGGVELGLLAAFVTGLQKKWTYGTVLVLHAISTLSSFSVYLHPYQGPSILFFAAWPMLAACFLLYQQRDEDTLWTLG